MAEGRGEIELYNNWFQIADLDRDGMLSGTEAVQFFLRSGLPQNPTLFKVWQYVAGDRPALNRQEFYTAMKLVSLAQANGGVLNDQQAQRLVNGLSGAVTPPRIHGLEVPVGTFAGPTTQQAGGLHSHVPVAGPPGARSASKYPALPPEKAASYQTAFEQLDIDKDGLVSGVECFPTFMRSGLPQSALKAIWDVVAGNAGSLNRHQFIQCFYLIDSALIGIPIPEVLPPGQFPPVDNNMGIGAMVDNAQRDIYAGQLGVAPMPPKVIYTPGQLPAVAFQSQVPNFAAAAHEVGISTAEMARLQAERDAALQQEALRQKAEEERVAAAKRREFFTQALADLRVAQSKVARTLNEAQQRLEMEQAEAESMESQYNAAYETFSSEHARAAPLLEALKNMEDEKADLAAKMAALQAAVTQLESYDPEWEAKEAAECEVMNAEITALMVRHEELQRVKEAIATKRSTLEKAIDALQDAVKTAEADIEPLSKEVEKVSDKTTMEGDAVVALLKRLAPLYNVLYSAAKTALVPLPKEALATIVRAPPAPFKYDPLKFAGSVDWHAFADDGFIITAAIPTDSRLISLTSPSLAKMEEDAGENPPTENGDCEVNEEEAKDVKPAEDTEEKAAQSGERMGEGQTKQPEEELIVAAEITAQAEASEDKGTIVIPAPVVEAAEDSAPLAVNEAAKTDEAQEEAKVGINNAESTPFNAE